MHDIYGFFLPPEIDQEISAALFLLKCRFGIYLHLNIETNLVLRHKLLDLMPLFHVDKMSPLSVLLHQGRKNAEIV